MRPLSEQIPLKCERQLNSLRRTKRRIRSACRSYQEALAPNTLQNTSLATIDYDELRETVKSTWRKRDPLEQLRIIGFVVPKSVGTHSDYFVLSHSNYKELMSDVCFDTNQCVFYELESGYSSGQSDSEDTSSVGNSSSSSNAVFNEFI
ncbi:hypothetical protein FBU31_000156, partial [Coemansia sp. 'formosensis']